MLRKTILALILLILVLGLSYIKTVRDHDEATSDQTEAVGPTRDTSIDPGEVPPPDIAEQPVDSPANEPETATSTGAVSPPDTLSDALKQTLRDYCQSVYEKLPSDLTPTERAAAAENIARETANRFAVHERKVRALWTPGDVALQPTAEEATADQPDAAQEQGASRAVADRVEQYFDERTAILPGDLTDVEQKIALDEIRKESAEKFELSLDEIYQIWQDRELTSISAEALNAVGVEKKTPTVDDDYRRRIADYYKERFDSLPANLTDYQRTVAVAELKYKTAEHFSISLSELEKIWQDYEKSES